VGPSLIGLSLAGASGCAGLLDSLGDDADLYRDGGGYPTRPCSTAGRQALARYATNEVGGTTRDFALLDQYGYRVRLSHFCGHSILLAIAAMDDPEDSAWLDPLPELAAERPPEAPPLTVITVWVRAPDGEIPGVPELRAHAVRLAEGHPETVSCDPTLYNEDTTGPTCSFRGAYVLRFPRTLPVLQDPLRLQGYGDLPAAAGVQWVASDVPPPEDLRPLREVSSRFRFRSLPAFVLMEPEVRSTEGGRARLPIIRVRTTDPEDPELLEGLRWPPPEVPGDD
jgi:hypothetical protein